MTLPGIRYKIIEIAINIFVKEGSIFLNFFQATLNPSKVFSLLLKKDNTIIAIENKYK